MPINAIKISVDSIVWLSICEIVTIASCSYRVLRLDNGFYSFVWYAFEVVLQYTS
jgi:hypothetical protein